MATRADAASAVARPHDSGAEMGAASRQDPARARQRPLPEPKRLTEHGPARIIAMCNQKGGVGKTTSTINLGASLAEYGRRVLLVDLDPQGALSAGLGVPHYELDQTVHNLLIEPRVSVEDVNSVFYFSHMGFADRARLFWRRAGYRGEKVAAIGKSFVKGFLKGRSRGES